MQIDTSRPRENGGVWFIGHPIELRVGDHVLDRLYRVSAEPYRVEDDYGYGSTQVSVALEELGSGKSVGFVTLDGDLSVRFFRRRGEPEIEWAPNFAQEPDGCGHEDHQFYAVQWEGPVRDLPAGSLVTVYIDEKPECKVIDSAWPDGTILFADSYALPAQPDHYVRAWVRG